MYFCITTLFQSAADAVEHGLSLWLPQLRNCSKSTAASADDSVEVCMKFSTCIGTYILVFNIFRNRLDKFWASYDFVYLFRAQPLETGRVT